MANELSRVSKMFHLEGAMKPLQEWGNQVKAGNIIAIAAAVIIGLAVWNAIAPAGLPTIQSPLTIGLNKSALPI